MPGLQFSLAELVKEAVYFKKIAQSLLDRSTVDAVDAFVADLRSVPGYGSDNQQRLELKEFRTRLTRDYDRRPGLPVQASVSGVWDMSRIGKRSGGQQIVEFCGIASLQIRVYEMRCRARGVAEKSCGVRRTDRRAPVFQCSACSRGACVASWKMDLGQRDSPGCYFHIHVLADGPKPPFPDWLPIRLPSLFATPMAALEFSMGELFQEEWAKTLASAGAADGWKGLQGERLGRLLRWMESDAIRQGALSPWMNLKAAKPPDKLFVS